MSDWIFLNKHRIRTPLPGIGLEYCSDDSDGFNGMFRWENFQAFNTVRCIASDGLGWQHVSVSLEGSHHPPKWDLMCRVKDLFWDDEDWVVQFHPAKSQYVNFHPGCLHLWRPTSATVPTPLAEMVGPQKTKIVGAYMLSPRMQRKFGV